MTPILRRSILAIGLLCSFYASNSEAQRTSLSPRAGDVSWQGPILRFAQDDSGTSHQMTKWESVVEQGRVAFQGSCTKCHEAERALDETKSLRDWLVVIEEMAQKNEAEIAGQDVSPIATYLATREPAKNGASISFTSEAPSVSGEAGDADANAAAGAVQSPLIAAGRTAFYRSCVKCHDADRALSVEKTFEEWMDTIQDMATKDDAEIAQGDFRSIAAFLSERNPEEIQKAAQAKSAREANDADKDDAKNDDEKKDESSESSPKFDPAVVAAGREAFYKSCVKCHDADRSLSKTKSLSAWLATVKRMGAKDGAEVRPSDHESIATFLASLNADASGDGSANGQAMSEASPWSFSTTLSTLERVSSDPIENSGFFIDAWVGADWQSTGPIRATVMACTSCHSDRNSSKGFTFELVEASATVDLKALFQKKHAPAHGRLTRPAPAANESVSTSADLKLGRFIVPFGAYSAISHPGSYRTVTNPLMFNMGRRIDSGGAFQPVLPAPYSDEGLNLHLTLRELCDRSYTIDLFAVNGLQGNAGGVNFNLGRSYTDNNRSPAVGGRFTLGNQRFRLGASGMSGRMQNDGSSALDYHLVGADATISIPEKFRAYFEYAFRRDENGMPDSNETDGYIFELEWKLREKLGLLARYDTLDHHIATAGNMSTERFTWGLNFSLPSAGLLLLNHEHWMFPDDSSDVDVIGARWVTTF